MEAASTIYQRNLDAVSAATWRGDFTTMMDHLALPNSMVTEDAAMIISSIDEMVIVATEFRDHLKDQGADAYDRVCLSAEYVNDYHDVIVGIHETRITQNGTLLRDPYLNRMTLLLRQGRWKGVLIEAETSNKDITILSPDLAEDQRRHLMRLGISLSRR